MWPQKLVRGVFMCGVARRDYKGPIVLIRPEGEATCSVEFASSFIGVGTADFIAVYETISGDRTVLYVPPWMVKMAGDRDSDLLTERIAHVDLGLL